ncbi:DUF3298 and DUF4163 domain-containing protein [Flagellimonas myxillae]|uniref:DUF3298 and DUF4163 domain-containing protein n=1 Tax=Flagellimonas myxillae TaxID=2942214 RepID=UPI00201E9CEB|nr:DUF3298 and DUF4163 domain-containing protein [Muricauda myxillae]MCL6267421.1 DUF3298 and DUF4163 domain-containing protein [Muricauda myxillae]
MNKSICLLLLLLLSLGCETGHKLTFAPNQYHGKACKDCPDIKIDLIEALDETKVAEAINRSLQEEVIALLSFDEAENVDTMNKAIASFTKSFRELKDKFPDETVGWEAKISSDVAYEDNAMLTLVINAYTFTGGAHGYSSVSFLNFDKVKGTELENWELFEDEDGFRKYTETKFRIQEDVPQDENINSTGFMFEGDRFHLSENLGYTMEGIQLIYNQYEIASYADGPKIITIPFAEANKYLKRPTAK